MGCVGRADDLGRPLSGRYKLTLGNGPSTYLDSGLSPNVGVWQHIAATYDGSTARFFLDGVEVASSPFTGLVGNSNTWRIGAYGATPSGFFDGLIDNVRIYDRALVAAEIQADMTLRRPAETIRRPSRRRSRRRLAPGGRRRRHATGDLQRGDGGGTSSTPRSAK